MRRLLSVVFPAWTVGLACLAHLNSLRVVPRQWNVIGDSALPSLRLGPLLLSFWSRHLGLMTLAVSLALGAWGVGRIVQLRFFRAAEGDLPRAFELALMPLAVGLGVLGYAAFAAFAFGWRVVFVLWALAALAAFLGVRTLVAEVGRLRARSPRPTFPRRDPWSFAFAALLALGAGLVLILSVVPEINFDALEYHLAIPRAYLQAGKLIDLPFNLFSKLPLLMSMIYSYGLALGPSAIDGMYIVKWLNILVGLGAVAAVFDFARALKGVRAGLIAAAIFLSIPMVLYFFMCATADLACVFFTTASCVAFWSWWRKGSRSMLRLFGLLAGFAVSTKYIALFSVGPLAVVAAHRCWSRSSARDLAAPAALGTLTLAPWWIRNITFGYHPFFPVVGRFSEMAVRRSPIVLGPAATFLRYSVVYHPDASYLIGPLFLALLPLLLLVRRRASLRPVAAYCVMTLVVGTLVTAYPRFLAQTFPGVAVLAAAAIDEFADELPGGSGRFRAYAGILILCGLNLLWAANLLVFSTVGALSVALGRIPVAEYLKSPRNTYSAPSFGAFEALDRVGLARGERVLIMGDPRPFYCPHPALANSAYDAWPIVMWALLAKTPEELVAKLDQEGLSAIVRSKSKNFTMSGPEAENTHVYGLIERVEDAFFVKYYEDPFSVVFLRNSKTPPPATVDNPRGRG